MDELVDVFVTGMATILWGDAWASHVEEHRCRSLSGCEITEVMPEIPEKAWRLAERFAGRVEEANRLSLPALYAQAMKYTGNELEHKDYHGKEARRFGECLAFMGMGHGVSWYDDHPRFNVAFGKATEMIVPGVENCDLQIHADETCEFVVRKLVCSAK